MNNSDRSDGHVGTRRSSRRRPGDKHQLAERDHAEQMSSRTHSGLGTTIDLTMNNNASSCVPADKMSSSSGESVGPTNEAIEEDDICPICQLLFCRPVTTSCNHSLCESCMATWADVSVTMQMQIVDVDEASVPFNAATGLEARCPLCRTQTSARLNSIKARELKTRYPMTYAEREAESEGQSLEGNAGSIQTLTLNIGNRHRLVPPSEENDSNVHEWVFFVKPSRTDIIEEVQIVLHPTFRRPRIIRPRPPYEVRRLGWGYFTITAYIVLKAGYSWVSEDAENSPDGAEKGMLGLEWTLDFDRFDGRGSMGRLRLKVRNERNWDNVSDEEEEEGRVWGRLVRQYDNDGRYVPEDET